MTGATSHPDPSVSDWRDLNHAWWEERAPLHEVSAFYRSVGIGIPAFEWEDLGPVDGLEVVHPQCHIGTDTLAFAQHGGRVVGLDFSANAIEAAGRLAEDSGLAEQSEWLVSDVYDSVDAVAGRQFDLVYTGKGAICWLPDLGRWADVMWHLCRPGGRLYMPEFHPVQDILAWETTLFERSYFATGGGVFDDGPGSYADQDAATVHNVTVDFVHPLSEVVQALLDAGFVLERFREFPFTLYERWPFLERQESGLWCMPDDRPELPMMYALRLHRPT